MTIVPIRQWSLGILFSLALALPATSTLGQTAGNGQPRTQRERAATGDQRGGNLMRAIDGIRSLLLTLNLTDDQKGKAEGILLDLRDTLQKTLQDPNVELRDKMIAIRSAVQSTQTQIRDLLDKDQKTSFDAGMDKLRAELLSGRGGMQLVDRLERAMETVDLTDEQKPKVRAIIDDAIEKLKAIRDDARIDADPANIRAKAQQLREEIHGELSQILTPDQFTKLRAALNAGRPEARRAGDASMPDDARATEKKTIPSESTTASTNSSAANAAATALNQKVPPFSLMGLTGKPLDNASLAGEPAVLVFGSYSSPTFRDKIAKLQELSEKMRNRAKFVLIYTQEMYPADVEQPTRNENDKIKVAAHKTADERSAAARIARDALGIKLEIAPDTMESTLQKTLGVGPNGAAIVGADGTLLFRQDWADPYAIERALTARE